MMLMMSSSLGSSEESVGKELLKESLNEVGDFEGSVRSSSVDSRSSFKIR